MTAFISCFVNDPETGLSASMAYGQFSFFLRLQNIVELHVAGAVEFDAVVAEVVLGESGGQAHRGDEGDVQPAAPPREHRVRTKDRRG